MLYALRQMYNNNNNNDINNDNDNNTGNDNNNLYLIAPFPPIMFISALWKIVSGQMLMIHIVK